MTNLELYGAPLAWLWLVIVASVSAIPALIRAFLRRATGLRYEKRFSIQRAPQLAIAANLLVLTVCFEAIETVLGTGRPTFGETFFREWSPLLPLLSVALVLPSGIAGAISWLGVSITVFGLVFMVGGWYSLGAAFSPDAEILEGHALQRGGMFRFVMHPVYSGIVHFLLGSAVLVLSLPCTVLTLATVAPLFWRRAKYEEQLLTEQFGSAYLDFAKERGWRRLVPTFVPVGL